jgi:hypothetical protein
LIVLLQAIYPMRGDYFLGLFPQMVATYLIFCALANWLSILAPVLVAAGAFKATNFKAIPLLLHFAFLLMFPLALAPTLLPLAVQLVLEQLGWIDGIPVDLFLSIVLCGAVVFLYRLALSWQGSLLQAREQRILEVVTTKAE